VPPFQQAIRLQSIQQLDELAVVPHPDVCAYRLRLRLDLLPGGASLGEHPSEKTLPHFAAIRQLGLERLFEVVAG
jgi:hypothetical protein